MSYFNSKQVELQAQILLETVRKKKDKNKKIIENLRKLQLNKKAVRIEDCGSFVYISEIDNTAKITNANFCRERLCRVCAWRRQAKFVAQTNEVLNSVAYLGLRYIFITLTVPNIKSTEASQTISRMMKAWNKISRQKFFKNAAVGYIRSLEMTYNKERDDYHPHLHALVAVRNTYFQYAEYITAEQLRQSWADAYGVTVDHAANIPNIDIKAVSLEQERKSMLEVLKYSLKWADTETSPEVVSTFISALTGRRLISFGGLLKETRAALKQSDFDDPTATEKESFEDIERKYPTVLFKLTERGFVEWPH